MRAFQDLVLASFAALIAAACNVAETPAQADEKENLATPEPAQLDPSDMTRFGNGHCSNRTLSGNYGGDGRGFVGDPGQPPTVPFTALAMTHFDGNGNLTRVDHAVINGVPLQPGWRPGSGTYTVNPDCTGTSEVTPAGSPFPLTLFFVVVKGGKEIHLINDAQAIFNVFIKVD